MLLRVKPVIALPFRLTIRGKETIFNPDAEVIDERAEAMIRTHPNVYEKAEGTADLSKYRKRDGSGPVAPPSSDHNEGAKKKSIIPEAEAEDRLPSLPRKAIRKRVQVRKATRNTQRPKKIQGRRRKR